MSTPVTITRGRLAGFAAALALGSALVSGGTAWAAQTFTDVPPSHPFYDEIEWGATHGIIEGYPDGTFRPGTNVTRMAAAAFLARYNTSLHQEAAVIFPSAGTVFTVDVPCPAGERAVAGGGTVPSTAGGSLFLTDSYPVGANDGSWRVIFETEDNIALSPSYVSGTALCAPAVVP